MLNAYRILTTARYSCYRHTTSQKWRSRPEDVRAYLSASSRISDKAEASLAALRAGGICLGSAMDEIDRLLGHAKRFADRTDRRVLQGETIPHGEKVFSIFEEHTRRISKGKASKTVELGVPVCVVEDGNGFVLDREIMWSGGGENAPPERRFPRKPDGREPAIGGACANAAENRCGCRTRGLRSRKRPPARYQYPRPDPQYSRST